MCFFYSAASFLCFCTCLHLTDCLWGVISLFSKAAGEFLQVRGCKQIMQVPRGRQSVLPEPLQNPPVCAGLGGPHAAVTPERERKEGVREDLGVRDPAGLAVGERVALSSSGGGGRRDGAVRERWSRDRHLSQPRAEMCEAFSAPHACVVSVLCSCCRQTVQICSTWLDLPISST